MYLSWPLSFKKYIYIKKIETEKTIDINDFNILKLPCTLNNSTTKRDVYTKIKIIENVTNKL